MVVLRRNEHHRRPIEALLAIVPIINEGDLDATPSRHHLVDSVAIVLDPFLHCLRVNVRKIEPGKDRSDDSDGTTVFRDVCQETLADGLDRLPVPFVRLNC